MYGRYKNPDKLKKIEPKQINENKKMDRKINNLDAKLQTLKIENKNEEIKEKQEKDHIISFNQKMININNNYNNHLHAFNVKEKDKEIEENMRKILEFRDTFDLSQKDFSDGKILDILKKYKFNFEEAFSSLFNN